MLHEIAEIIGSVQAVKLGQAMGGARIYFPAKITEHHPLSLVLGLEDSQKLCEAFSGDVLYLPSKKQFKSVRNKMIRSEYHSLNGVKGLCRADFLAIKYGLSRRNILYIVKPSPTTTKTSLSRD
jgi:Mor family transcriptional regulator